ncbi:DNA-binding transcriptional regulator, FadR family [Azospirillum oryzae]|uniref:DNA-binding transcriptional regulator, FadR family n=1 Tax=Azospirillum oryzae TaxID=286727 RepID=A0A1X7HNP7_9PROT|nr:FadR/GntR family transcriptional regulator [Azospirillum oryzae]SMF90025.1 DNA-binding transcriptional regulator, FadR family [Azospirillum oryzae]
MTNDISTDDGAVNPVLSPESGKRSAELAEILQDKIVHGGLAVGESLPSERDLMVQYSVSRATVREALRILGAKGLIEVRRGRRGGSYISAPSSEAISRSLDLFIQGHEVRFSDLLAVREAIEPVAAAQAALYRTKDDIKEISRLLHESNRAINDLQLFSALNLEWHLAIVRASHNPLFLSFMTSIGSMLYSATERDEFDLVTRTVVARSHRRIYEAIAAGDAEAARRRMMRHVTSYSEQLDLKIQEKTPDSHK